MAEKISDTEQEKLPAVGKTSNGELTVSSSGEEKEIDLIEMAMTLWKEKKMICWWCVAGAVLGLIIAFSIPREYTTDIKLAPELNDASGKSNSSVAALAAMAGMSNMSGSSADAVYPMLYPDIIQSIPFEYALLSIPIKPEEYEKPISLQQYMEDDVKSPWWGVITSAPLKLLALLKSDDEESGVAPVKPFQLSKDEKEVIEALQERITCEVDEKTMVVTISVTMQDPMVSAVLADTVTNRLKEYVTAYRTNKSREDMMYLEKLQEEAKQKYYEAQQRYAKYLDTHQGIVMYSAQTMRDRLENEATLAFNVYNQTAQKLEVAKAKVQEETPVFATIEPASVPLKPSAPRKILILVGFVFLSFVIVCVKIIVGKTFKPNFLSDYRVQNMDIAKHKLK